MHSNRMTKRNLAMLRFVNRYRLATDALFRLAFFPDVKDEAAVAKVTRRLVQRGYLRRCSLKKRGCHYYILGWRGARLVRASAGKHFTEQSLPAALAIAYYCVRHGVERFTANEFRQQLPDLAPSCLRSSAYYMVESASGPKVGMFLIDRGGSPRRVKAKLRRVVSQRYRIPAFLSLIQSGRFCITVLTGLEQQQAKIARVAVGCVTRRVSIEVALVAELGELMTWS